MDHGRLDLLKHLGEGAFAKVQHARLRPEEGGEPTRDVAVKTLRQVGGSLGVAVIAACVALAQGALERTHPSISHVDFVATREGLRSDDQQALERARNHPQLGEMREIVAGSFAVGYVAAALGTLCAFVVVRRMMPAGRAHPPARRGPRCRSRRTCP